MGATTGRATRSPSPRRGEGRGEGVAIYRWRGNPPTRIPRASARNPTSPLRGEVKTRGRALALRQCVDGEIFRRVGEHGARLPAGRPGKRGETRERVFVAVLGVD